MPIASKGVAAAASATRTSNLCARLALRYEIKRNTDKMPNISGAKMATAHQEMLWKPKTLISQTNENHQSAVRPKANKPDCECLCPNA